MPEPDEIVSDNLRATQIIWFAWQLDEMRLFAVADRVVEQFMQGLLPVGSGATRLRLSAYAFSADRLAEAERRSLYARVLGVPGGTADVPQPGRDFPSLWLRFLAAAARFQATAGSAPADAARRAALATAWQAAQDLARHASLRADGLWGIALRVAADVNAVRDILRAPEVAKAYGARDMWQLIDAVSRRDLGGPAQVARHRALAESGSAILAWLAAHTARLNKVPARPLARSVMAAALVDAVGQWIATGRSDATNGFGPEAGRAG